MNRQYARNPVPRRAGLAQPTYNQTYSDAMVDSDDYNDDDSMYDDQWPTRTPRSAIRYTTTQEAAPVIVAGGRRYVLHANPPQQAARQNIPQPRSPSRPQPQIQPRPRPQAPPQPEYDDEVEVEEEPVRQRRRLHPLFILGVGMVVMLALWVLGSMLLNWWNVTQDDWHFGRPRTFQVDAVVGHNHDSLQSPSHFIAMNFHSRIQIIEFPGCDTTKAKIYPGPTISGDNQDLAPVTLMFKDVNGDGKPDMIIAVASTHVVLINDGGQFRLLKPGEQVTPY